MFIESVTHADVHEFVYIKPKWNIHAGYLVPYTQELRLLWQDIQSVVDEKSRW